MRYLSEGSPSLRDVAEPRFVPRRSAAEELLDPDVETVTPRGTLRGIAACRQVLQKASGDEQFAMEQAEPEFEEIEGDVIARTQEVRKLSDLVGCDRR